MAIKMVKATPEQIVTILTIQALRTTQAGEALALMTEAAKLSINAGLAVDVMQRAVNTGVELYDKGPAAVLAWLDAIPGASEYPNLAAAEAAARLELTEAPPAGDPSWN